MSKPSLGGDNEPQLSGDRTKLLEPYATNYELWAEALASLTEIERRNVEIFARDPDHRGTSRKGLVLDIREKMDVALKLQRPDNRSRRIIDHSLSLLNKFASVGDVAVSFDPVHAALPWAAVRSVLVVSTRLARIGRDGT
jgi:ankyrin repeat domain-containing protein 50